MKKYLEKKIKELEDLNTFDFVKAGELRAYEDIYNKFFRESKNVKGDYVLLPVNVIVDKLDFEFMIRVEYDVNDRIPLKPYPIDKAHPPEGGEIIVQNIEFTDSILDIKEEIISKVKDAFQQNQLGFK